MLFMNLCQRKIILLQESTILYIARYIFENKVQTEEKFLDCQNKRI